MLRAAPCRVYIVVMLMGSTSPVSPLCFIRYTFINGGFYSPASYPAGSLCSIDPVLPLIRFLVLVLLKLRAAQVAVSWAAKQLQLSAVTW